MDTRTDVSRPARGLCEKDVLFLLSLAFLLFAFAMTIAVIRH